MGLGTVGGFGSGLGSGRGVFRGRVGEISYGYGGLVLEAVVETKNVYYVWLN